MGRTASAERPTNLDWATPTCIQSAMNSPADRLQSTVYDGSFDPSNVLTNQITTQNPSPNPTSSPYGLNAAPGQNLVLAVDAIDVGGTCPGFTSTITS